VTSPLYSTLAIAALGYSGPESINLLYGTIMKSVHETLNFCAKTCTK